MITSRLFLFLSIVSCRQSDGQTVSGPRETHAIPSWGNNAPGMQIELPRGFHIVSEKGADFDVHGIFDSTAAGQASRRRIGIYVGHHPSLFASEDRPAKTAKVRGTVANRAASWVCWETQERGSICEAQVRDLFAANQGSGVSQLVLHLWVATSAAEQLAELRRSAGSLQLAQGAHK